MGKQYLDLLAFPAAYRELFGVRQIAGDLLGTVRHAAFQAETAKPAIGKIEVNLCHQPPF